jgi:histidinol-phosphatase (PHP family)
MTYLNGNVLTGRGNLHTHTVFCDGRDTIDDYCQEALRLGFSYLGFSAHAPIERKTGRRTLWHLREDRLDEYLDAVAAAKLRARAPSVRQAHSLRERAPLVRQTRMAIYAGLEVDYVEGFMGPADPDWKALLDTGRLDYLIGSVHYVFPRGTKGGGEDMVAVDAAPAKLSAGLRDLFAGDGEALAAAYWREVLHMVESGAAAPGFAIVGHLDLVKKHNARLRLFDEKGPSYTRGWKAVVEALKKVEAQRPPEQPLYVEINTGGMNRNGMAEPYPGPAIIAALKQAGIPLILSSDAHRREELAGHFADVPLLTKEPSFFLKNLLKVIDTFTQSGI